LNGVKDMSIEHFKLVSVVGVVILAGSIAKLMMPVMNGIPVA
jgi:hypothetical protein